MLSMRLRNLGRCRLPYHRVAARGRIMGVLAALAMAMATVAPAARATGGGAPPRYAVTILSTLSPDPSLSSISNGNGINDLDWVVGDANYPGTWTDPSGTISYPPNTTEHATLWRDGRITDLGTLGGPNSSIGFVSRPNDMGLLSGNAQNSQPDPNGENWGVNFGCTPSGTVPCNGFQYEFRGFEWRAGVIRPLPTLGGNNEAAFGGGNDEGQIVGMSETANVDKKCQSAPFYDSATNQVINLDQQLDWRPVVWGPTYGETHRLPLHSGDHVGIATAINDEDEVVGGSGICTPPSFGAVKHALLWRGGSMIDLGSLGGSYDNFGTAINDRGQVVGWSDLPGDSLTTGTTHAFFWQNGAISDLGTLQGDTSSSSSFAYGINDAGQVVGQSCDEYGNCEAVLWQNGAIYDLNAYSVVNTPGSFDLLQAEGINTRGEIAGIAVDNSTGNTLGFLAMPCGDPAAGELGCENNGHLAPAPFAQKLALGGHLSRQSALLTQRR